LSTLFYLLIILKERTLTAKNCIYCTVAAAARAALCCCKIFVNRIMLWRRRCIRDLRQVQLMLLLHQSQRNFS